MNFIEGKILNGDGLRFESFKGKLRIQLNDKQSEKLKKYIDAKIWVGIRPEDIHDGKDESIKSNYHEFEVMLEIVEPMGNEVHLFFNLEDVQFISRVVAREVPKARTTRTLKMNLEKLRFFNFENEEVLG
jgi:multiple sugar transport system ATP-binding protein